MLFLIKNINEMKKIIMLIVLSISAYMSNAQCNITGRSLSLKDIDTQCSGYKIKGNINNTVIVTGSCGKLRFTPPIVDIFHKTSNQNVEKQIKLLISPNPFLQDITINLESSISSYEIVVSNILGNIVFSKTGLLTYRDIRIDLSGLTPGSYFVLIKKGNNLIFTKKLIKLNF